MPKRVLAIGIGGSGKAALTILKERLEETYGQVPDNVVLLSMDTDDLRLGDVFAGTSLSGQIDERKREPEFRHITSKPGVTMDRIFADLASGRTSSYMYWIEKDRLDAILGPSERDIRGGAQQRRPVGRVGFFQRWDNPIVSSIREAITRMYGEPEEEQPVDAIKLEQSKRLIFIIGSVAGGTGSGFLVDTVNLVRHVVLSNTKWQSVDVSAIVVLPDAFSTYTTTMNDPTNLKPNSYAALRELDRFIRTHSAQLPYMIRYEEDIRSITWSTGQPCDHVYLVDTASPSTVGETDLTGDPMLGVFPLIADFVMSHVDQGLGDALATLRSNAGNHYDKEIGWQYSSFNVLTYLFPIDDIIESFSYKFLRELMTRQFLPIADKKIVAQTEQEAQKETEKVFSENTIQGRVIPNILPKSLACTQRVDPERPDMSWTGLFNMVALSESAFAEDYQDLQRWLDFLNGSLIATGVGDHKKEKYDEGYVRLLNFSEQFMDDCLGPKADPDNEDSRFGGEFDKILGRYRDALRSRFAEALDAALLEALNKRDANTKVLQPARLPFARVMASTLKEKLVRFKTLLEEEWSQGEIDTRLRQTGEELRNAIAWMQETKDTRTRAFFGKPEARKAQDSYIGLFSEKMQLTLHRRIYDVVLDVMNSLGAAEEDRDGKASIVDLAALELENWQLTFQEVDKILAREWRLHEKNRAEKRRVKVRRYLTNPEFENQLYAQPQHSGMVGGRVLGQVRGETGVIWKRIEEIEPLDYKLVTVWTEEAKGPEEIARKFFTGVKGLFRVIREHVVIADRIAAEFTSPTSFVNTVSQINEPFLRYNPSANEKAMFHERYASFNLAKADEPGRIFLEDAQTTLRNQGLNVDTAAESLVAGTIMEVSRGVHLRAVDQFLACEPEYRTKLYKGRESLHLFAEEQMATRYEGMIDMLGEPDNRQRPLSPAVVIAMGDEAKLRLFTLACAYGVIDSGMFLNNRSGAESTEVFLNLTPERRSRISDSVSVRNTDKSFDVVGAEEQLARLYLNALQNFVLKTTQKPGVPFGMITTLVQNLAERGVELDYIENPLTLAVKDVTEAIRLAQENIGPSDRDEVDRKRREGLNARRRVDNYLEPFLKNSIARFKRSPAQRVRDMGTVMHLILNNDINRLKQEAAGV